jgi:hypothetical protein
MNKTVISAAILLCNSTLTVAETKFTLSPSLIYFDYTEFSTTDEVLDRELGWLPGIELTISHSTTSDWAFDLTSAYYQGTVDYTGQTQTGIPHTTDTTTKLLRFGGHIKKDVYTNTYLFAGAQFHQWNRDIKDNGNISGIDETYKWLEYSVGINYDILLDHEDTLSLEAAYLITRNATIDVDLSRINHGSTELDIGNGTGGRIRLGWRTSYTDTTRIGLTFFFEAWDFGRSNTKATRGGTTTVFVTEPRSETRNTGLQFNIEHNF